MPRSEATRRAQNKYDAANRMMLGARVTKADGERFRAICEDAGQTVNAALVEYVRACLERGSLAAAPVPSAEQPPQKSPEVPAPEQAARKSPEPPKREQRKPEDLDALIEQKQRKLAEQVAEMQRQAEAKAAEEAKEEAERQNLREEIQKAVQQYAIQFNREQARLAGDGKKFKEWDDLYVQNKNDILHAAKFRHYREVFTLQELTPRERMARGFPMFDEEPKKS